MDEIVAGSDGHDDNAPTTAPRRPRRAMPTIAVAATFSCEPVGKWLRFWLEKLGVRAEIRFAPHGTLQHELVKPTAAVRRADAFVALLCLSDWQRGGTFDSAKFDDYLALFVSCCAAPSSSCHSSRSSSARRGRRRSRPNFRRQR